MNSAIPKSVIVKNDMYSFYQKQSSEKTADIVSWLNSGSSRIPQPESYYYFEDRKITNALDMSKLQAGSSILEIGCNLGQMTFPLAEKGFKVVAFDLSKNAIEKATKRADFYKVKNVQFEVQDAEQYKGHEDESFDSVFSFSAFRYFPDPVKALKEANRVLKKKGTIIVDFPNKSCPWFNLIKRAAFIKSHIHDNIYSQQQIFIMMRKAGFVNVTFRKFLFTYKELPSSMLPLMKTVDFLFERIPVIKETAAILMVKGEKL
jgi:cyclopropane fatty-acyl-phospholipid synthase-like methyltransferase